MPRNAKSRVKLPVLDLMPRDRHRGREIFVAVPATGIRSRYGGSNVHSGLECFGDCCQMRDRTVAMDHGSVRIPLHQILKAVF